MPSTAPSGAVPETWDMEAEIVILGAGGAGLAAACTAKEAGASVLVLEKAEVTGGDTALSEQGMLGPWPEGQKAMGGIDDTVESYMEDLRQSYKWGAFADAGRPMPDEQPFTQLQNELVSEMMDWTMNTIGVGWTISGTADDPICEGVLPNYNWGTKGGRTWVAMDPETAIIPAFNKACKEMGIDIHLRTEADRLIANEEGRIVGVYAYDEKDNLIAVKATKAVIVATGCFAANRGMMARYLPNTHSIQSCGCAGATGDGIRMIRAVGGTISEMDLGCHWIPLEAGTNSGQYSMSLFLFGGEKGKAPISQQPGIMLNYEGKRFVAETNGYSLIGRAIAQEVCQESWYVFDSHPNVADLVLFAMPFVNRVVQADSIEELCELMRIPVDATKETIEEYNGYIATGKDSAFDKCLDGCQPVDQGPFYAINLRPKPYCTYGGVDVDLDAHVLNGAKEPIKGLYAAGIVTGSFSAREGFFYNGAVNQALVFGRLAAKNAIEEEAWAEASPTGDESAGQSSYMVNCSDCHGDHRQPGQANAHGY